MCAAVEVVFQYQVCYCVCVRVHVSGCVMCAIAMSCDGVAYEEDD